MSYFERRPDLATPYLIAEIGVNHENSLATAEEMVKQVAAAGWHAAKFQTYKAELLASRTSPAYWDRTKEPAESQFQLFKRYDGLEPKDYRYLATVCREHGIDFMSTPFDLDCLDWLVPLMPAVKIASADITNEPLLKAVAAYGKPVVLSSGASTRQEIRTAVLTLTAHGAVEVIVLHCVLRYPTEPEHANLTRITSLRMEFPQLEIGYSDHVPPSPGMPALVGATALGASVLEKHFTLDKSLPGNDHYHAADVKDLRRSVDLLRDMTSMLGAGEIDNVADQQDARLFARRSLVTVRELRAGTTFAHHDLVAKRPASGISPQEVDSVVGRCATRDLPADHILSWEDIT